MRTFSSHGYDYVVDDFGVVNQLNPEPFVYDANYVSTYDTDAYRRGNEILQALRLGFVIASHGKIPASLQDNGYGNGAFMQYARQLIDPVFGRDVTGVEVPGCIIVSENRQASVYTFWDCLEHIEDISFIRHLPCETLCISLPWCHYTTMGQPWFDERYKHRKPNEHLRHFNPNSLEAVMAHYGWKKTAWSTHEDIVRKSTHGLPNILSMAFKRVI